MNNGEPSFAGDAENVFGLRASLLSGAKEVE